MTLSLYVEVLLQGVLTGLVYGLMALGLSVIFGVVRVVNFAHGEFAVLAMYSTFVLFTLLHIDPILAAIPVAALFFFVGWLLQRLVVQPFIVRPQHDQFILLVGLAIVLVNALLMTFGPDSRHTNLAYSYDSWFVGPIIVDKVRAYAAAAAVAITIALLAFFRFTLMGTAIRACADNLTGAAVVGLDIKKLYALTFGLGLACAGAAGAIMVALTIVIIGGLGSMAGALLGGLLIGVVEALASAVIAPSMKSMVSFALLVVVLALRPQGLLGKAAT
jgi:branched-chain amino acid transport system permease protein